MNALPPLSQAGYHAGCSLRHLGKALVALWLCRPLRWLILACLAVVFALLAGCASPSGPTGILTAIFGRKQAAATKAEAKVAGVEDKAVTAAQVEVFKTSLALEAARAEAPSSRPVEIASRTNQNALEVLNQREPLTVAVTQEAREIIKGLLTRVEEAERKQKSAEASILGMTQELSTLRTKAKELHVKAEQEAARNLELANQLRWAKIVQYAGVTCSALLGLLAIAYRLNLGRFQQGAAEVLAKVGQKYGEEGQSVARGALDAVLHTGEQKGVAKAFFALTSTSK